MNVIHVTLPHIDCKRPLWIWSMSRLRTLIVNDLCECDSYNVTCTPFGSYIQTTLSYYFVLLVYTTKQKKHLQSAYKVQWTNLLNNKLSETIINAPEYLRTSFTFATDIHTRLLRSTSRFQLYTPKPHLDIFRNRFVFSCSSIWNSLHSYIQNSNSVQHLKSQYLRWINTKPSYTVI